jgi:hypothetical protein
VAFQVSVNLSADIYTDNDPLYNETKADVEKFGKVNIKPDFPDYILELNWHSKKDTWRTTVTNDLIELYNKMPQEMLVESKLDKSKWGLPTILYMAKIDEKKEQLTEEWVEENLRYMKLDYPSLTPQEVVTGEKKPYNSLKVIDSDVTTYALTKRITTLGIMIVINALMEGLVLLDSPITLATIALVLFQLMMIMVNVFSGYMTGIEAFKRKRLNSMMIRRDVLIGYVDWQNKRLDIHKLKSTEVVADKAFSEINTVASFAKQVVKASLTPETK